MNKAFLVAMREYVENLRTKTFWIGILAFPVIIIASIVLGRLMASAKDIRTYTVVDRSEGRWLSRAIDEKVRLSDMNRVLREAKAAAQQADAPDPAQIRADLGAALADLSDDHTVRPFLEVMLEFDDDDLVRMARGESPSGDAMAKLVPVAMSWYGDPTKQKQLRAFAEQVSLSKYEPVTFDDLGPSPEAALNRKLQNGELFAYFVINEDPLGGSAGCRYVSNNVTDDALQKWYTSQASEIVRHRRVAQLKRDKNLTDREARLLNEPLRFDSERISAETGEIEEVTGQEKATQFAPVAFVYLLWIAVFTAAQMLLTNTVEEKSNRIIEVLLSSVSPLQLMTGKIFGIAATGLTVVLSWVVFAIIGVKLLPMLVPGWPAELNITEIIGDPVYLASFVAYFIAGYFFFAALLVGIGSVCNSLKEAQNLLQPVILLLIVPMIAMFPVVNDPNGTLARVLTYIPPFTPFLMMNRAAGPPPTWEYVATTALLVVSILAAFWGAAKVFRIGILMTGKPPKIREIFGWLRAPVGSVPAVRSVEPPPAD